MRYLLALALLLNITASQARTKVLSPQQQFAKVLACYYEYEFNREHYNAAMAKAGYSKVIVTTNDSETNVKHTTDTMLYNDGFIVYEALESNYTPGNITQLHFHYSNSMVDTVERYNISDSGRRVYHNRYKTDGKTYVNYIFFQSDTVATTYRLHGDRGRYTQTEYSRGRLDTTAYVYIDTSYKQYGEMESEEKWTIHIVGAKDHRYAKATTFDFSGDMLVLEYNGSEPYTYRYKYRAGKLRRVTERFFLNDQRGSWYRGYADVTRYRYFLGRLHRTVKKRVTFPSTYSEDPKGKLGQTRETTKYRNGLPISTVKYQIAGKKLLKTVTYQYVQ